MPVKIRQKQTKKVSSVTYHEYYHNVNKNLYETLAITEIYELFNSISGKELWQATLEKQEALDAILKHPDIFRIEYSEKNTKPLNKAKPRVKKIINELNAHDVKLLDGQRLKGRKNVQPLNDQQIENHIVTVKTEPILKKQSESWIIRLFTKVLDSTLLLMVTILGTVVGTLLVIMIVNYYHNKGFKL